jgi:UDP-N-acetylmuramoyl-tripeptide--D-alanyl-D-alanine ligase
MQAALNTLSALSSRKVAIIGDMAELEDPATAHEGLETSGVDLLILVGSEMKALKKVRADARWFASTDEAMAWVETNSDQLVAGDYVLIKGSRSMKLDRMVRLLTTREALHAL